MLRMSTVEGGIDMASTGHDIQNSASPSDNACCHRWIIDPPSGGRTSMGICRRCGAHRPFLTAFADAAAASADR
jgi:hypothetical protein